MNSTVKFDLTSKMKREGIVLTINWAGGTSSVITGKQTDNTRLNGKSTHTVQRVQKSVQSIHNFSKIVLENWLANPASGYIKPEDWKKKSESERIRLHIVDYVHDMSLRGQILSYYVS